MAANTRETPGLPGLRRLFPTLLIEQFQAYPGDYETRSFIESLREQLAASLSSIHSLEVTLLTKAPIEIKRERGDGRCFLTGRVNREGRRLRVILRLVDDATLGQLWGDSFDGTAGHLFDLGDRVVDSVLHAIPGAALGSQINAAQRRHAAAGDAQDISLRVLGAALSWNRSDQTRALEHLRRALYLDPYCALAAALAGWCHVIQAAPWNPKAADDQAKAQDLADLAGLLDPVNPFILSLRAMVAHFLGYHENAENLAARAVTKRIGEHLAWTRLAWLRCAAAKPDEAISLFERADRVVAPYLDGIECALGIGTAHFQARRYEDAERWLRKASLVRPTGPQIHAQLAACYARLVEKTRGRAALAVMRRSLPDVTTSQFLASFPCDIPSFRSALGNGLNELGLPP
jgi:adenylate cyclase